MPDKPITNAKELVEYLFTSDGSEAPVHIVQLLVLKNHFGDHYLGQWDSGEVLAKVEELVKTTATNAVNNTEEKFVEEITSRLLPEEAEDFRDLVKKAGNEWMAEIITRINNEES